MHAANPNASVAATKSFIAQLIALYWLVLPYSRIDMRRLDNLILDLRLLPVRVQRVLDMESVIADSARKLATAENVFYIGRGINYPTALEGALKLKEISYIHAEGYAAGELKHGPFALLGDKGYFIALDILGCKTIRKFSSEILCKFNNYFNFIFSTLIKIINIQSRTNETR